MIENTLKNYKKNLSKLQNWILNEVGCCIIPFPRRTLFPFAQFSVNLEYVDDNEFMIWVEFSLP